MSRYHLRARLARGGMGEIWLGVLASAEQMRRPVVLKRAIAARPEDQPVAEKLLVDEALVASGLSHPNVIHVYELVRTEHGLMLAMEYLHGLSLRAILRGLHEEGATMPRGVALRIAADVAAGLAHAHGAFGPSAPMEMAVVHRDVSPENVLVTAAGVAKLIDFGSASAAPGSDGITIDEVRGDPGTLAKRRYAAPEQHGSGAVIDARADVYALGIVAREMLEGSAIPPAVDDLLRRMTLESAARRTIRAEQAARALESAAQDDATGAREVASFLQQELGGLLARAAERLAEVLSQGGLDESSGDHRAHAVSFAHAIDTLADAKPIAG